MSLCVSECEKLIHLFLSNGIQAFWRKRSHWCLYRAEFRGCPFVKSDISKWVLDKRMFYQLLYFFQYIIKGAYVKVDLEPVNCLWELLLKGALSDLYISLWLMPESATLSAHVTIITAVWSVRVRNSSIKNKIEKLVSAEKGRTNWELW